MRGNFRGKQGMSSLSAPRPVILASILVCAVAACDSLPSETNTGAHAIGLAGATTASAVSTTTSRQGLAVVASPSEVTAGGTVTVRTTVQERTTKIDSRTRVQSASATSPWTVVSADAVVELVARAGSVSGTTYTPPTAPGMYWVVARIPSANLVDSTPVTVVPVPVIVAISPRQPSLVAGAQQQFATTARWADAVNRPFTTSYSATGGTVSSTGLFTAGSTPGTYQVIGACSCGGADTAVVSIRAVPTLASIAISPRAISLDAGATQQFSVSGLMSDGTSASISSASYNVTAGSITPSGMYTAPSNPGSYRVIVAPGTSSLRDTSIVTVRSSSASLPFFEDNFDSGARSNANGFTWGESAGSVTVGTDQAFSGTRSLLFAFGPNAPLADAWVEQRFNIGRYLSEVWIEYMLYAPSNFVLRADGGPTNNKFFTMWRDTYSDFTGGTWQILFEYQRPAGTADVGTVRMSSRRWDERYITDNGLSASAGVQGQGAPLIGGVGPIRLGAWNRIRFHIKAASSRQASDGVAQMWVNDAMLINYTSARFHNNFDNPVDAVLRNGYFLGWANSGFTERTVFAIDNVKFYSASPLW